MNVDEISCVRDTVNAVVESLKKHSQDPDLSELQLNLIKQVIDMPRWQQEFVAGYIVAWSAFDQQYGVKA